jgi:hypothetical protein
MSEDERLTGADPVVVTEAFAAARELLQGAEQEAARIRQEAEQHARQREQEAELLVAKARRLLGAAEEKAVLIIAAARAQAPSAAAGEAIVFEQLADLGAPRPAPADVEPASGGQPSELDHILASAIASAVDAALPAEPSA